MAHRPAGICLAAGASTRMGLPKALLRFGERTAAEVCLETLARGGCSPVVLVLGAVAGRILTTIGAPQGVLTLVHAGWESGRSGSLKAGIEGAPDAPAWVVLPVDHPLVGPDDVSALVTAWAEDRPPLVRPVYEGRGGHPVLFDAVLRDELLALEDDEPLRNVVHANREREATVPGSAATRIDLNTPEDYWKHCPLP